MMYKTIFSAIAAGAIAINIETETQNVNIGSDLTRIGGVAAVAGAIGLAAAADVIAIARSSDSSIARSSDNDNDDGLGNTCWKPLSEMNGRGFFFQQQHVAGFLQDATDSMLVMNDLPQMTMADTSDYSDYPALVDDVIELMSTITTESQQQEIEFFDGKLNIATGIMGTLLLGYGQSVEELMLHGFGETTAVHDAGVTVWKNKLMNSRIRPTSVIQNVYPDKQFDINNGISVVGKFFQATIRVMPHSEYPSGSSCVCQAVDDFLTGFWPELTLTSQGNPVQFDPETTPVILPNSLMPAVPFTGTVNPSPAGYTSRSINERCGQTRLEGGQHFSPSVPAGRDLCEGMGSVAAETTKALVPGVIEGTTDVRTAIASTAPCAAECCANQTQCSTPDAEDCAAQCVGPWDMPWFDVVEGRIQAFGLPNRTTATTTPFFQANRNHLMIMGALGSTIPDISLHEGIFQMRATNTINNIIWNSFAANSETLKVIKFGQSHEAQDPIIRSDENTTDARVLTAIHAMAAALPLLVPGSVDGFRISRPYALTNATIGFDDTLVTACGAPEEELTQENFNADCLRDWYNNDTPSPSRLGQIIAYEIMYFKVRDGWNSLGTDGGCDGGPHFCFPYADVTKYDPESGQCLNEDLVNEQN